MRRVVPITHYFRLRRWHAVGMIIALAQCEWPVLSAMLGPAGEDLARQLHLAASAATTAIDEASTNITSAFMDDNERNDRGKGQKKS